MDFSATHRSPVVRAVIARLDRAPRYPSEPLMESRGRGVLDHPPEPVIGRRVAPTRWRVMTTDDEAKRSRLQTSAPLLWSERATVFQPGAREERHGQGSDAPQQGKEETEGRQEPQEGRRRAGQSVRGGQDPGRPEPEQQEELRSGP